VQHGRAGALREADRIGKDPLGGGQAGRVRGVVQVDGGRGRHRGEIGPRLDRKRHHLCVGECGAGQVVGIAGVWQQQRRASLDDAERKLGERRLDSGHDRHLARGIELDSINGPVAVRDRLLELG
jgi:hypothetical protein